LAAKISPRQAPAQLATWWLLPHGLAGACAAGDCLNLVSGIRGHPKNGALQSFFAQCKIGRVLA
jgi:hypothetical protein